MPKLIAPHGASWRGRALAACETVDADDRDMRELVAHGFCEAEDEARAVPVESSIPADPAPAPDIAALSRKDLIRLLRGKGVNLFVPTDALRALAAKLCAAPGGTAPDDSTAEFQEAESGAPESQTPSQTTELKVPHGDE